MTNGYHRVQAERDLESNWEVDLALKLEHYLLKICSGQILDHSEDHIPVNFAEAALLLQGSVQVYSRKVEYLHSLVLRALEFLSTKRQEEQLEGTSDQPQDNIAGSRNAGGEESDFFWEVDNIPVEAKNCLDTRLDVNSILKDFVKPPANLVVLEGDCLDSGGDAGELESYLLATSDLYRGFILLDPCDAVAVHDYLDGDNVGRWQNSAYKGSSARKNFQSPTTRSAGALHKSSVRKSQDGKANISPQVDDAINSNIGPNPHFPDTFDDDNGDFDMDDGHFEFNDFNKSDDEDDPWKPLNPHEPGNLKIKPFRKVKASKRIAITFAKRTLVSLLFPPARSHGADSTELRTMWEMQNHDHDKRKRRRDTDSVPLPLYEKLRQQLVNEGTQAFDAFFNPNAGIDDEDEANTGVPDFDQPDDDIPGFMDEDVPFCDEQRGGNGNNFGVDDPFGYEDANIQANLEDLCRSHLDALLASIAETEKQSELASRVTTWKLKIEKNLDEQDSHPEFDIHRDGQKIIDKLSHEDSSVLSFSDIVKGEVKYDVARTFSALLQLVNNGDVELDRNGVGGSVCFTAANPFHVRLLRNNDKHEERKFRLSKKRVKSPLRKTPRKSDDENIGTDLLPLQRNGKFPLKVAKLDVVRCTPEGKKRRKSRLVVEPVDLSSS